MQSLDLGLKVILIITTISLLTLLCIFVENLITQTSFFAIKKISINGAETITESEILNTADVVLHDNIMSKNLYHIQKRLIRHPWIRDAAVKRKIPSTLMISLREEIPLARLELSNNIHILINIQGEPFAEYSDNMPESMKKIPVVTGIKLSKTEKTCSFSGPLFKNVMEILKIETGEKINKISADDHMGIQLEAIRGFDNTPGGEADTITLKMGFSGYAEKLKIIPLIYTYVKANYADQRIGSMDLVNLDSVIIDLHDRDSV